MSYKLDEVLTMLDQILMRLDRIERAMFKDENIAYVETKLVDKPKLTVIKSVSETNNVVEFDPSDN